MSSENSVENISKMMVVSIFCAVETPEVLTFSTIYFNVDSSSVIIVFIDSKITEIFSDTMLETEVFSSVVKMTNFLIISIIKTANFVSVFSSKLVSAVSFKIVIWDPNTVAVIDPSDLVDEPLEDTRDSRAVLDEVIASEWALILMSFKVDFFLSSTVSLPEP